MIILKAWSEGVNGMKLYYTTKILICGMYPGPGFVIDGYIEKSQVFDEKIVDANNQEYYFYFPAYMMKATDSFAGQSGEFYDYFENEEKIELNVEDHVTVEELQRKLLKIEGEKVLFLQKKLRLITGLGISLPVFRTTVYDEGGTFYTSAGWSSDDMPLLTISDYTDEMKNKLNDRLSFRIVDSTIINLEEKNARYKRALQFYTNSFDSTDIGVRFILLFSALEPLFNISKKTISEEISTYGDKILFLGEDKGKKCKLKKYYGIRSRYIHGNDGYTLTEKEEIELRDCVREILLIYWIISTLYEIYNPQKIKELVEHTDRDQLDTQVQIFIKYMRTSPEKFEELYEQIYSEILKGNCNVLSNENIS